MKYKILITSEFEEWLEEEPAKSRRRAFWRSQEVRDHVWELRWENGRRIYYSLIPVSQVLLLLGGNKNGQTKDINQAEKIYKGWVYDQV